MPNESAPVQVEFTPEFKRNLRALSRKYPHIHSDVQPVVSQMLAGDFPGDRITGTKYVVFKVRVRNSDIQKGKCVIRAMPTIDSDGCRPPIPKHADQLFRRMASSFPGVPESVVALVRNQWTACSGIRRSRTDPIGSGAG